MGVPLEATVQIGTWRGQFSSLWDSETRVERAAMPAPPELVTALPALQSLGTLGYKDDLDDSFCRELTDAFWDRVRVLQRLGSIEQDRDLGGTDPFLWLELTAIVVGSAIDNGAVYKGLPHGGEKLRERRVDALFAGLRLLAIRLRPEPSTRRLARRLLSGRTLSGLGSVPTMWWTKLLSAPAQGELLGQLLDP
jgi:hypothetical protein